MRLNFPFPRGIQVISSALGGAVMLMLWALFAPTQVGGLASYVVIIGSSMEPNFHIDDLVIAHEEPRYKVGDAVVYKNADLESYVFHRITSERMGHFSLQGDNNSWVDNYQPSRYEIIGKLWVYIPRGGTVIRKIRSPWGMAFLAAGLGGILATSFINTGKKGDKSMNKKTPREWFDLARHKIRKWLADINTESQNPLLYKQKGMLEGIFFGVGLIFLSSLFLGIFSFSRATTRAAQTEIQYQELGIFTYTASAPQGIYDLNTIKSGDPIFPNLTCQVDVTLQYTLIAPQVEDISGTYQLTAVVYEPVSGWERNIPLQDQGSFTGTIFGAVAKLDTCNVASLIQTMEQETNFHPGSYRLVITPNVKLNGTISGKQVESNFNSGLTFYYDRNQFHLIKDDEVENPLSQMKSSLLQSNDFEPNTMILFGSEVRVVTLRWLTVVGMLISLTGFVFLGVKLQNLAATDQGMFFRVKYDSLIVDVQSSEVLTAAPCVDLKSIDALARLAERFNTMILHAENGDRHIYLVQSGGQNYRFEMKVSQTGTTVPVNEAGNPGGGA